MNQEKINYHSQKINNTFDEPDHVPVSTVICDFAAKLVEIAQHTRIHVETKLAPVMQEHCLGPVEDKKPPLYPPLFQNLHESLTDIADELERINVALKLTEL
jgi:hypothetical protein